MRYLAALLVLALACGCGEQEDTAAKRGQRSDRLVDFSQKPPYVNALDIDPATGEFLLTTNKGFWRIDAEKDTVARVRGSITAQGRTATVGTFLELLATGPRKLIGSGHPDQQGSLPSFLGFISSDDGGRNWTVVSRLGEADLHKIVVKHRRMYAFDAVLGAMLISADGGRTFTERFTPPELIIDFEVDPRDPQALVASSDRRLYRSDTGGQTWRAIDSGEGIRLVWPAPDALYRAERDGKVQRSRDGGRSWQAAGTSPGEPYKFKALAPEHLYLALSDGSIVETEDGARTWKAVFQP